MGRLINERDIINQNISQHIKNTYKADVRRFAGTPTYVTYYNKNIKASEQDRTLETVAEIVGKESPLTYNKISNFPLYAVNEITPNLELDEFGLNTNGNGEAVILPNTIKPYVDDLFTVIYMEENFLFRVTSIEIDRLNGRKFYKIQYEVSQYKIPEVEEKIDTEFSTEVENIGTNLNPIIEKNDAIFIKDIESIIDDYKKFYIESFMDNKFKSLIYQYNDKLLYNEFLVKFIYENKILDNINHKIFGSYYIQQIFPDSPGRTELYKKSIYYALVKNDLQWFKFEDLVTFSIQKNIRNCPFSVDYRDYYRIFYVDSDMYDNRITEKLDEEYQRYKDQTILYLTYDDVFGKMHNTSYYKWLNLEEDENGKTRHIKIIPHNNEFIKRANEYNLYEDNEQYFLENILIKYFNNKLIINKAFLDELINFVKYPCLKEFLLIPCIIFILKNKIVDLTKIINPEMEN